MSPRVHETTQVKLIDFGTLHSIQDGKTAVLGTLRYMSPHVLRGCKPREQDDLYSLGVTLYQWFHQKLPMSDIAIDEFVGHVRLGSHPFSKIDFKACGVFAKFTQELIYGGYASAEVARQVLEKSFGEQSLSKNLFFPQSKSSSIKIAKIRSQLQTLLKSAKHEKRIIWIDGPMGSGKSTLIDQSVQQYARENNLTVQVLPTTPQNSVVAAVRMLGERFSGINAFSGLDPLTTTQRLLSRAYRVHFFRLACEMVEQIIQKRGALILVFQSVSEKDFFLLDFLCKLNAWFTERSLPFVIIATSDLRANSDLKQQKIENPYLFRLFDKNCSLHLRLVPWSKARAENYLRRTLGRPPRALVRTILQMPILVPGAVREFLESAYRNHQLVLMKKKWLFHQDKTPVLHRPTDRHKQFLSAVLPYLPQPTTETVLRPLFSNSTELRSEFVQMVQDGLILKDEARYFWRGDKNAILGPVENLNQLRSLVAEEPLFLLPLCQHDPSEDNAKQLLQFLNDLDHSDRYMPFPEVFVHLIRHLSKKSDSIGLLYYHLGRVQSLNGKILEARESLLKALHVAPAEQHVHRYLTLIELGNVLAKSGKHEDSLLALHEANVMACTLDERLLVQGLEMLTSAFQQGVASFPIGDMKVIVAEMSRLDFSGRIALRYAQGLFWADCLEEAEHWIDKAILDLQSSRQFYRLARAQRMKARMMREAGHLQQALELNEQSLSILQGLFLPQEEIETLMALFYLQRRIGNEEAQSEHLAQIARLIPLLPDTHYELIWPELVALTREEKHPEQALFYYRSKEKLARSCQSHEHEYVALANQGILELTLGKSLKAKKTFKRAKKVFSLHGVNFPLRLRKGHEQLLEYDA